MSVRRASETLARSSPSMMMLPLVGLSKPPSKCNSVDLPQPDGPIIATNSPSPTSKDKPLRAGTSSFPILYDFFRSTVRRIGFMVLLLKACPARLFGLRRLGSDCLAKLFIEIDLFKVPRVLQYKGGVRKSVPDRNSRRCLIGQLHRVF